MSLLSAQIVIGLVLVYELALIARFLSWRRGIPRPNEGRNVALHGLLLAAVLAFTLSALARKGALAPGLSGAGQSGRTRRLRWPLPAPRPGGWA